MIDIVDRLQFDAVRVEAQFSKGVAGNIEAAIAEITKLRAERDAAARDMRERAAMAVRNKICTIPWPPEDGDELIDELMAVVRALPDTPAIIATDRDGGAT